MYLLYLEDCQPVGELAEEMSVRPATITGLTDRLVRQELIERQGDAEDRRVVRVTLTVEGRRALGEIEAASRLYLNTVFERMGGDAVERLIDLFEQFSDAAPDVLREGEARV